MSNGKLAFFSRALICEGPEDAFFFQRLLDVHAHLPRFHIYDARGPQDRTAGNTKFWRRLESLRAAYTRQFNSLADVLIVADNDQDAQASFANVCAQIEQVFGPGTAPAAPQIKTATTPPITVLMLPWTNENGHLEMVCVDSARDADRGIAGNVDAFMGLIAAARWNNESRFAKAWLRTNLAARCARDPFVPLGLVFDDPRYQPLIPVNHPSLQRIIRYLATFGAAPAAST